MGKVARKRWYEDPRPLEYCERPFKASLSADSATPIVTRGVGGVRRGRVYRRLARGAQPNPECWRLLYIFACFNKSCWAHKP